MTSPLAFDPVETIPGDAGTGLLLLCDHASFALPPAWGDLGLPEHQRRRHIGWDIGARAVTLGLAARFGAPALLTTWSRLLIDPNRGEDDPTLVMRLSDGAVVPGNAGIDEVEIARRIALFHRPYHEAIDRHIDASLAAGVVPLLIAIHSFTPIWKGWPRPWEIGILWDRDPRAARPLIEHFRRDALLTVGDNEPYHGALEGDTLHRHGTRRGLPHALIEVRQDLIEDEAGAAHWAERIAEPLAAMLADGTIRRVEHHGSLTDRSH